MGRAKVSDELKFIKWLNQQPQAEAVKSLFITSTFYHRANDPGGFRVKEINQMAKTLKMKPDDLFKVITKYA